MLNVCSHHKHMIKDCITKFSQLVIPPGEGEAVLSPQQQIAVPNGSSLKAF